MRNTSNPGFFPWLTIFTGIVGFALQFWLLSSTDVKGLLPQNHIAGILSFLLLALTLAAVFLLIRKAEYPTHYEKLFPKSALAAAGSVAGALAMGYSAFTQTGIGVFHFLLPVLGALSACALLVQAYCRLKGMRPHNLFSCTVAFYLIFQTLTYCRQWGIEPQTPLFFFQLLASLFLLLTCYYRAELDANTRYPRQYTFFSQAALFCCCLCIPGENSIFYLLAAIWIAADGICFRRA